MIDVKTVKILKILLMNQNGVKWKKTCLKKMRWKNDEYLLLNDAMRKNVKMSDEKKPKYDGLRMKFQQTEGAEEKNDYEKILHIF
jgi:hypothetical protein